MQRLLLITMLGAAAACSADKAPGEPMKFVRDTMPQEPTNPNDTPQAIRNTLPDTSGQPPARPRE